MRSKAAFVAPVIIAVAIVSSACGSGSDSDSGSPSDAQRNAYLAAVKVSGVKFADDDEAIKVGQQICDDVADGTSVADAAKNVEQASNSGQSAAVVGAAIGSLCPGHAGDLLPDKSDLPTMPSIDLPG